MNDENAGLLEEMAVWIRTAAAGSYLEPGTGIMLTGWHFINGSWCLLF